MSRHLAVSLLGLLVAGLVFSAAPAAAYSFPNERPASPLTMSAVKVATVFWSVRGVDSCSNLTVMSAPSLLDDDGIDAGGRAWLPTCKMWVLRRTERQAVQDLRYVWDSADGVEYLCATVIHELGHLGGLQHSTSGVMSAVLTVPYVCVRWAREQRRAVTARRR